jgi:TP901 family phage tail tape measure protein
MSSQNIEVGLRFTADASQAKRELDSLKQNIVNAISSAKPTGNQSLFNDAIKDAEKFYGVLNKATDPNGALNLSRLQVGLKEAGLDIKQVANQFTQLGPEGAKAWQQINTQIQSANANASVLRGTLSKFAQGLKNTAMWTIQSNAIHAVQSALQGAYSYAQKLNKGLTDIAIVSNLNADQLAAFADSANKAAKELSTTTNEYVKGALIYYQQGLNDEAVKERTETTIKMANASGESAETISSYMTAIWNNFDKGSESVEYYADVIALLGATTAASNAQIAEGMQAFAATAETVGLSYEYSAAALTTLVDRTQQSASKIGTSLKTIFARLSSVSLGETLEDGVNLTKYTKALEKVGVDVLTATGDLKDMDEILDELGNKWDLLNQAQKVAVAQTVGGVRQYNNLISLLDNYDYFKELVNNAKESEGYLQTQQDKYAAS